MRLPYRYRLPTQRCWLGLLIFILSALIVAATQAGLLNEAMQALERNQPGLYSVRQFVDGDTLVVNMNGRAERVRMIGVDTPETHKPNTPVQCYGPAAASFTKNVVGQQRLRLVSDSLSTNRDRYDRLLRYVYLPDGTNLNERLIREGYGFYYPYFPFTKSGEFAAAQAAAQKAGKGLWKNCSPTPTGGGGYVSNSLAGE